MTVDLRFCAATYDLSNLDEKLMHLSNNSIQKQGSIYKRMYATSCETQFKDQSAKMPPLKTNNDTSEDVFDWTDFLMWPSSKLQSMLGFKAWHSKKTFCFTLLYYSE